MIYRPGLLQTETVLFSDQEKLLEKVDLRYLKTLKAKKLNTKTLKKKNIAQVQNMWWYTDLICATYRSEKNQLKK